MEHKVAIVVDRAYGNRLVALTRERHVWIVDSPANRPAVERVWSAKSAASDDDLMGPGATIFYAESDEDAEAMCVRVVDDVEVHHGEGWHDPPWTEILVVGTTLTPELATAFEEIGPVLFTATEDGFMCRRAGANGTGERGS